MVRFCLLPDERFFIAYCRNFDVHPRLIIIRQRWGYFKLRGCMQLRVSSPGMNLSVSWFKIIQELKVKKSFCNSKKIQVALTTHIIRYKREIKMFFYLFKWTRTYLPIISYWLTNGLILIFLIELKKLWVMHNIKIEKKLS